MAASSLIDKQIQKTNDYSSISKHSMCAAGYQNDRFFPHFVAKKVKRAPIINRGYYVRMKAISQVVTDFLNNANESLCAVDEAGSSRATLAPLNIIVLGAGYDTLFFRLNDQYSELLDPFTVRFVEIDYLDVCLNKSLIIQGQPEMQDMLYAPVIADPIDQDSYTVVLQAQNYALVGFDMRKTACFSAIFQGLGLDFSAPTLVLAEVVLPYIDDSYVMDMLKTTAQIFENALFVNYEQVEPADPFGRVMLQHFDKQKTPLLNVHRYPTVKSHTERFLSTGWKATACLSVSEFWTHFIPEEEKLRIDGLEPFDEYEEFFEKIRHYVLALAATGDCDDVIENYRLTDSETGNGGEKRQGVELAVVPAIPAVPDALLVASDTPARFFQLYGHASIEMKLLKTSGESVHVVVLIGGVSKTQDSKKPENDVIEDQGYCVMHDLGPGTNGIWISTTQLDSALKRPLIHHTAVSHSSADNLVFVAGGRTSPLSPNLFVYSIELSLDEVNNGIRFLIKKGPKTALLRSELGSVRCQALALTTEEDQNLALVVQSLNAERQYSTLNYFHFEIKDEGPCVTQVALDTTYPARFASCALWGPRRVVLTGGLRDDLAVPGIFLFDTASDDWPYLGEMTFPRFGHTSHIYGDQLILIGGVSHLNESLPDISVYNLLTKTEKHFKLQYRTPAAEEGIVMLFNHTSQLITRNEPKRVMVFGGGGNCFSFGTHFNTFPFYIELSSLF